MHCLRSNFSLVFLCARISSEYIMAHRAIKEIYGSVYLTSQNFALGLLVLFIYLGLVLGYRH